MSDDFLTDETPEETPLEEAPEALVDFGDDDDEDDPFAFISDEPHARLMLSNGSTRTILFSQLGGEEPTAQNLLDHSGLSVNGRVDFYVDGTQITGDTLIASGQDFVCMGNIKGA